MLNVFLLMGQSNMAGRGLLSEVKAIESPNIQVFRNHQWEPAREPLHEDRPTAGVGLAMSFAETMIEKYPQAQIGLIPCAVGSSPLNKWLEGAELYIRGIAMAREGARNATIKGILWHQGENDSQNQEDAVSYLDRFAGMIAAMRRELDVFGVPVIVGELGDYLKDKVNYDHFQIVNACLRKAGEVVPRCGCASSKGLTHKGDNLHFNASSLRQLGNRYAREYLRLAAQHGVVLAGS